MSSETAITRVLAYLDAMERRALDEAAQYVARTGLTLVFPGGRRFGSLEEIRGNSAGRYRKIGKRIGTTESWRTGDTERVLVTGTLYGEWPDGTPFEDIRFVDIFALQDGLILRQEVWNDTGERLVDMQKGAGA